MQWGQVAVEYFDGILRKCRYGRHEAQRILSLLHGYPKKDGLAAMQRGIQYHAFGYQSLERILAHVGTPKANWELLSQREQEALQRITESTRVEARPRKEYQQLIDQGNQDKQHEQTNQPQTNQPQTDQREKILQYLEILKVKLNQEQLDSFLQQHTKGSLSVSELLAKFLEQPANASQELSILSRIRRAGFPTEATLESYDWTRNPNTIRREPFSELATGEFIRRKENVAFVGLSGLGKTHLMQGVARKCCSLGYRVKYETSASLIEVLNQARAVKRLTPKVRQYCSYELLIIDEFGFEKLERKEVPDALSLLYKVIDGRNRRSSTAIITNVSFDDWTEYLGDPPMTMALLDRVVDQTNLITFAGDSIRKPKKKPEK